MVLILSRVQNVSKRLETSRINAMRHVYKIKPDSSGLDPESITLFRYTEFSMDPGSSPE
jgi:hypothetical protein